MHFNQFFKQYQAAQKSQIKPPTETEDFDFNNMVNNTNINDASLEKIEVAEEVTPIDNSVQGEVVGQIELTNAVSGVSEAEVEE